MSKLCLASDNSSKNSPCSPNLLKSKIRMIQNSKVIEDSDNSQGIIIQPKLFTENRDR